MNFRSFVWDQERLNQMKYIVRVDYLVIHHTESPDVPIEEVDRWHRENGWLGVGYHYLIRANGDVEQGRPEDRQGAQVSSYNWNSLGIALTGNFMPGEPTEAQMRSLAVLIMMLRAKYPTAQVVPHKALGSTSCPGDMFPWDAFIKMIDWKEVIIQKSLDKKLITQYHNPDEPAPVWFVLQVMLNSMGG